MSVWDGFPPPDRDEDEGEPWSDPLEGEVPGRPKRTAEDPDEWKPMDWPDPKAHLKWDGFYEDDEEGP